MHSPLVSIICLSYNHGSYIREAVESVLAQTHKPIELIIVDDHSSDGTTKIIREITDQYPGIKSLLLDRNRGNCAAFNRGFLISEGDFIIDLAADDILLPDRVKAGIESFERSGKEYGVNFTDARYIDDSGRETGTHYRRNRLGTLIDPVPEGDIFADLLARYFICTPSMMIRRTVLQKLGGYDESLTYEDFDFWIRSSRYFKYCYTDRVLVNKRILRKSLSSKQYQPESGILESTWKVCLKAEDLLSGEIERTALVSRCRYEFRRAIFSGNLSTARKFAAMLVSHERNPFRKAFYKVLR